MAKQSQILRKKKPQQTKTGPVWKGPEVDGVTQSLLSRFLVCKERFRILTIEGLKPHDSFSKLSEYGQMWHTCEEALAAHNPWDVELKRYCQKLVLKYPDDKQEVEKWYLICKAQFPLYVKYWQQHPDVKERTPLLQEETFCVPYELPSGRVVKLRGKWDSVDLIGKGRKVGVYLQENKTKGQIDQQYMARQLTFDMQTMIYLIALKEYQEKSTQPGLPCGEIIPKNWCPWEGTLVKGVRYNVIRRPGLVQRGGRMVNAKGLDGKPLKLPDGSTKKVRQGQESSKKFAERIAEDIESRPHEYFMRWKVEITAKDIQHFKNQFLDPCLEHLCFWYDYQTGRSIKLSPFPENDVVTRCHVKGRRPRTEYILRGPGLDFLHYRFPYGVYNPMLEGRGTDLEEYMLTGSTVGLQKVDRFFTELE